MIQTWAQFLEFFTVGLVCGFGVGFTALSIRYVGHSLSGWFRAATRIG